MICRYCGIHSTGMHRSATDTQEVLYTCESCSQKYSPRISVKDFIVGTLITGAIMLAFALIFPLF